MTHTILELDDHKKGAFKIYDDDHYAGLMTIRVTGQTLTAGHTEVFASETGKGLAHQLLDAMVAYAREHKLKVNPVCPFVLAEFKKHPDKYQDIWEAKITL
jgi:hypothetical protein